MKHVIFIFALLIAAVGPAVSQTKLATELYKEAKADKSKTKEFLDKDFSAVDSTSMHDLAVMFYQDNDYRSAGKCWEVALQKVEKHGKAYEKILECLSLVYSELDDNEKIQWLMGIIEEHNQLEVQKDCNDYKCKIERAKYYYAHGNEAQARKCAEESLNLCKTEQQRIEAEEEYAQLLFYFNDFESSAQYYFSASRRWTALGTDVLHAGTDMYWAAQNYILASKYQTAEMCSREAMECLRELNDETGKKFFLMNVNSLGDALYCQKKYEEALEIYRQNVEGYESWSPSCEKHADALEDMAKAETRLKKYDKAKEHYNAALVIYKDLGVDDKYSNTYSSLMLCMRNAGENAGADLMENEADNKRKTVYQNLLDTELPDLETTQKYLGSLTYANSLNTIASSYFGIDRYADAAEYYGLYVENLRIALRERFLLMTGSDRQRIWNGQRENIEAFRFCVATVPDSASDVLLKFIPTFYDIELLSKGIMLNSSVEFEKVLHSLGNNDLVDMYHQTQSNQVEIEKLQNTVSEENLQKVLELKRKNASLEQQLTKGCAEFGDYTEYLSYTWKDVQKILGEKDVAIEFTSVQLSPLPKDTYLLALILTDSGEPSMEIISTGDIIKNIEAKDDLYDNPEYFKLLWGMMKKHIKGKKRVFFAPNNMLSNIAVEYIKDGDRPFFETHDVYRLSSTKELCRKYTKPSNRRLRIFGNIDYNAENVSETKDAISFGRLAFSKMETDSIAACMKNIYDVKIYEKDTASESNFKALSEECPVILHVSSHGAYSGNSKTEGDEAMEKSYLALSGVNVPGQQFDNDGMLKASDVAKMNLRDCDLAVLSACKTGVGALGEDGIWGLQRGFKNAGVHSLLMSLKSVYDESTAELMIAFYKGLADGLTKRQALSEAQKNLRSDEKYAQGKYWAPFILLDALDLQ